MYRVLLVNFTVSAGAVSGSAGHMESRELADPEMRLLLEVFCGIDPVENESIEPEIRVQVRDESYLLHTGQRKLILYDARYRELPALVLTVEEAMRELDGSAAAARSASVHRLSARQQGETAAPAPPAVVSGEKPSPRRLLTLGTVALLLLATLVWLRSDDSPPALPRQYRPVGATEAGTLRAGLAGVYLTGNEPGDHGLVLGQEGEAKLFELDAVAPPRVVYATIRVGRIGSRLVLATDQPGGLVEVKDSDTLSYGGETYRRIP
jgi:hypothetical protein